VHHLALAVMVREVERDHVDLWKRLAQRLDPGVVRPVAPADEKRARIEPERVTTLRERWSLNACGHWNAGLDEIRGHHVDLTAPSLLPGAKEHRADLRDDRRVIDVDRVGIGAVRGLREHYVGARFLENRAEGLVLRGHADRVGLGAPAVGAPDGGVLRSRCTDEHASQPRRHALTAVIPGGNLHRGVETTARLTGLEPGGGCAAKYSAALLEELLAGFAPAVSENLLVGLSPADDAAVYKLDDERALIFTTDFFPPMVDDADLFGAVAAVNALNDVFAMGGKPLLALSIAAFPEELPVETVRTIFDAAARKVEEAGALLAGGHTIRDTEPKYGLAVVGTVHPEALWRKNGARPGDALFLTKPLGTGLVLTAVRNGALGEEELAEAGRWMTELNGPAADVLRTFQPNAVTDVTGFGLFGHAYEVAERSAARLVLEAEALPALPGALAAAERALLTGGDARNRDFAAHAVSLNGAPGPLVALGYDPQTAGGLLVALAADRAAVLDAAFRARGLFLARIGRVEQGGGVAVV
jgi:selenide, water dikinase